MGAHEQVILPFAVIYLLFQIPPTMYEIYAYYLRGGLVQFDCSADDTMHQVYSAWTDWFVYFKRFVDRPQSEAARAYFAYLDWSAAAWDKSIYIHRRFLAKRDHEVSRLRPQIYGPFIFNWKGAHDKQWVRGEDAAGWLMPMWGNGGEARARAEYTAAKDRGFNRHWHYQIRKRIVREQEALAKDKALALAASASADAGKK